MTLIRFTRRKADAVTPLVDEYIQMVPSQRYVVDDNPDYTVMPTRIWAHLDENGQATIEVPPTPVGWAYYITEEFPSGENWWVTVPDEAGPIDDSDLPVVNPDLTPAQNGTPIWALALAAETAAREAQDAAISADVATVQVDLDAHETNVTNPHNVTKAQVGLSDVDNTSDLVKLAPYQKKPDLASWPTYIYGNSYGLLSAAYFTSGNHYTQQVAASLGGGLVTSYAIGGKRILDVISALQNQAVFPGLVTAPVAGSLWPGVSSRNGLIVLESIVNDIGHYPTMVGVAVPAAFPSGNTRYLDSMTLFYRTALALMSSESRVEQSARSASSGTWTHDSPTAYASGSSVSFTTQAGAYIEYSITPPQFGPMRGIVFIHGYTLEAGAGTMAQQTISVDGTVQLTRTPTAWEQYTGPGGGNVNVGPDCVAVTVPVDNAAHTIRIAHSGAGGQWLYSDCVTIPSTNPNPIAVMGGEHQLGYTGWTTTQRAIFHQNAKTMIPYIKNVVAEFPHAFYVPSTMTINGLWSADVIHPNDRGMTQRANDLQNAITTAIRARLESRRLSNLADSNFPIV